jgi:general secretion pathway protein G
MFGKLGKAKHDIARSKMAIVEKAIEEFAIDCGRYPYESEGLDALIEVPDELEEEWQGRYCKPSDLLDPWGNEYIYIEDGIENVGSYDIISYGKDNEEGGEGESADIINN